MLAFFHALSAEDWARIGQHSEVGPLTIEAHAVLILGHDGYHAKQFVEWLAAAGR
jgi:hypothetical protein